MEYWYNYETRNIPLKEQLSVYLKSQGIYYELSGAFSAYHFEIKCNEMQVQLINSWLEQNVIE